MKIFILDIYYEPFLKTFYLQNPELKGESYKTQKKAIINTRFGTADFFSRSLNKLGHKSSEIIANNEILQRQWAKERGMIFPMDIFRSIPGARIYLKTNWFEEILLRQIEESKPDLFFNLDGSIPETIIIKVKKKVKYCITHISCPMPGRDLNLYDLIITSFPHYVPIFRSRGIKAEYLALAFESTLLDELPKSSLNYPAVFIGGFSRKYHSESFELMEYAAKKAKVDFWGYGMKNLSPNSPIRKNYHGEAWGLEMYKIMTQAKITLNRHGEVAKNYANNMRLYEATGVGTLLLTDFKDNLHKLFELGKEVETYKTKEELVDKVKYYLSHEKERQKIAKAGQRRTLKDHTYESRMKEFDRILQNNL